ncbi:MAG: hypothetical protein NC084_09115 [Bacteroides sp.]|nr:hypothetical protein [Eubacterium sp.]MCM1419023.1 hypothetical protein [Roseburia sp.]MCM1462855.1 hypothetical protein [Bacteroides sp.]
MQISGIGGVGAGGQKPEITPLKRQDHPEENALQAQLANKQKELQALSENEDLDPKQRLEKRKEIEAEIAELNNRLQQMRNERLQGKDPEKTEEGSPARKRDGFAEEAEKTDALLAADQSVKQAKAQNASADRLKGKARVLRTEAKLDAGRGIGGEKKLAEASSLESRAEKIKNESAEKLGNALKTEKTEASEKAKETEEKEKEDETSDVIYQKDGSLVEQAEEKERELDERA